MKSIPIAERSAMPNIAATWLIDKPVANMPEIPRKANPAMVSILTDNSSCLVQTNRNVSFPLQAVSLTLILHLMHLTFLYYFNAEQGCALLQLCLQHLLYFYPSVAVIP